MVAIVTETWRADIEDFLADIKPIPLGITERSRWRVYAGYRDVLCELCGWDAPEVQYEQQLYDRAHAEMLRRLEI